MSRNKTIICENGETTHGSIIGLHKINGDEKLWRYMSIDKFVHMMIFDSIFIPAIEKFDDKREGAYTGEIVKIRYGNNADFDYSLAKKRFFSLCFHQLAHENELMWRAYAPLGGVALATKAKLLENSQFKIDSTTEACEKFYVLKVLYGNNTVKKNRCHPIAVKQEEYSPENEVRMIFGRYHHYVKRNLDTTVGKDNIELSGIKLVFDSSSFENVFEEC